MDIIHAPDRETPKGRRDTAILATLFGAGIRRSELVGLRIGDVKTTANKTTFLYLRHTKAKKDAEQAVPKWAANHLWSLIEERKKEGAKDADYVFLGYTGRGGQTRSDKPISDTGVYLLFKHYCQVVGAGTHATPHLRPGDSDHKASCRRFTSQASAGVFEARKYSDGGMVR